SPSSLLLSSPLPSPLLSSPLLTILSSLFLSSLSCPLLQPPTLTKMPESLTAFSLDDIMLLCEATGIPTPSFRWVKDGKKVNWMGHNGSGNFTAHGDKPLSDYQGHYRCYADNTLGTAMTHTVKLITESTPTLPKQKRSHKTAEEGASVVLHCNPPRSSTIPHIHWMDKKLLHIGQSERVTTGLDGNLYFANVLKNDSRDDYTCNAQYISARTILPKEPISLTVTPSNDVARGRKPQLMQPQGPHSSHLALRGHSLVLECIPKGLPTPSVLWKRMDVNLSETGAWTDNHGRWLRFDSITQKADGEYECLASNTHGSVTHSYTVTVEAEPYWVKEPPSLLYSPGETVRLDCQADGIPTPTVTWSINGEPVADIDPRRRVTGGVLVLKDVVFGDTAVYQCEATNKHGNILKNTYIYVIELPAQILSSDGVVYQVTEGGVARLHCEAFGSPRPQVTWESEDLQNTLLSDSRVSQLTNGTLELFNSSREDSGVYTCSITHNNTSITAHLEVLKRTVMLIGPQAVQVTRGGDSWLDCHFTFDPHLNRPQILWRKDGQKIMESSLGDKAAFVYVCVCVCTCVCVCMYVCVSLLQPAPSLSKPPLSLTPLSLEPLSPAACPSPPVFLSLSEEQDHNLTLSWTPGNTHNSPTTEFVVEVKEEKHPEGKWESHRVTGDVNHLELHLLPYSTYRFRVSGVNRLGRSDPSEISEAYSTLPTVPETYPLNVRSESTEPGTLVIMWEEIDRRLYNGSGFQYKVSWRQVQEHHWSHTHVPHPPYLVNGTRAFSSYEMKVQAVNSLGEGPHPVPVIGHSGEDYPLASPSKISVSVDNSSAIVRWQPVDTHTVQGHLLGYKVTTTTLSQHSTCQKEERWVVEVDGNKTKEVVTGLKLYSLYELSMTTFNRKGEGPHSPTHPFRTPEGVPGPPASLDFESPSETELTLHWRPPTQPNGQLVGYVLQYQQISDSRNSPPQVEVIYDPTVTHLPLEGLDPHSRYVFYLRGRTSAGQGPPITRECATLLDGVPPSNISTVVGERSVNLSWVPGDRYRNHSFHIKYLSKTVGGKWEESEQVNTLQAFYSLTGLQPGTQYRLLITHGNYTHWEDEIQTTELRGVEGDFATQGWFIGLISAVVLLLLLLLVLCFIKRSKGGKYAVKDKEESQMDSEARPIKDETFGEYSDGDEKRSVSQPSLCVESKLGSDDSLAEYGDSVDIQFNEDGSFIGQYSGRGPLNRTDTHTIRPLPA
uniref:Neural cell adhesion molecule L1 n=1 Tax=Oncorhynchus tshawytscha TaxID=74940 RepID=A0A8C8EJ06_ONCTS